MTRPETDPDYATVGGILLDPAQLDRVHDWLRPEDFARPLCGEIYQLLTRMHAVRTPIDPVTVLGELRRAGRVRADGYPATELIAMVEAVPVPSSTPYYAGLVLEGAVFRRMERCGERIVQAGRDLRGSPADALEIVAQGWGDLLETHERWQRSGAPGSRADAGLEQDGGLRRGWIDASRDRQGSSLSR